MFSKVGIFLVAVACFVKADPVPASSLVNEFADGNHKLTASIYKELLKINEGNFLVSPFSVETILALTQFGAQGETANEIRTALRLPESKDKIEALYREVLPKLKGNENYKLNSANRVYIKDGFKVNNDFKTIAEQVFSAGVENINFTLQDDAAHKINQWVEEQTNKKIRYLISPDSLNDETRLILVNALYFNGKWANRFEQHLTHPEKFYKSPNEVQEVASMHQTDLFNYYECNKLNAKFLELPYLGEDVSMVIVLPNDKYGLSALEQKIESVFEPREFTKQNVYVSLPKFSIESKIKFVPLLQNLGIKKAFNDEADLSGIGAGKEPLYISDVVQKTYINVTEAGTEASAATAVSVVVLSISQEPEPRVKFIADHPFTFFIKYRGFILFSGRYTSPF